MRTHIPYRFICILSLICIALYTTIALLLFDKSMSSIWFYSSVTGDGPLYAHVAATLFYFAGITSWLIVPFCLFGIMCALQKKSFVSEWDRVIAWFFLSIGFTGICAIYHIDSTHVTKAGGLIGITTVQFLQPLWGLFVTTLFFCALIAASFVLLTRWCYMPLVHTSLIQCKRALYYAYEQRWIQRTAALLYAIALYSMRLIKKSMQGLWNLLNGNTMQEADMLIPADAHEQYKNIYDFALSLQKKEEGKKETMFPLQQSVYTPRMETPSYPNVKNKPLEKKLDRSENQNELAIPSSSSYVLPALDIFIASHASSTSNALAQELETKARLLEEKLQRFGISGTVVSIKCGPIITLYEYQPTIDTKISKILALEDDLALALQALSIRIIAPIPGKSVVGFEVANGNPQPVLLSKVLHSQAFCSFKGSLPLALGVDTIGESVVVDLARMPHLLIAGSTGSGKSVALNAMLTSLLCYCTPDHMKLILIDPKRLEFAAYADIAHLLFPIVTDPKRANPILRWVVQQMEQRYELMAEHGVRTVKDYNTQITQGIIQGESVPFIVVVIDELSDLMMTAGRDIEDSIARIAQMARAAGIHLIVATQRPSVDVITGLIKVNFPSRISFRVTSRIDSRTILDTGGAEKLVGRGDSLFLDSTAASLRRLHGAYVSDAEIHDMVNHIRKELPPSYLNISQELMTQEESLDAADAALYQQVIAFLQNTDEVSISLLQREFRIGYNRSARIIDQLEKQGLLLPPEGSKPRKVVR